MNTLLLERLQDRAQWDPADGGTYRARLWIRWGWNRIRHGATVPPAPGRWSEFQRARKNAAAFALLALGTNANAGFGRFMEAYAAAPKHESVSGARIPGPPLGVYPSDVTELVKQALPEREEELIGDIIKGLGHTNAWCRVVAAGRVYVFPEHLERTKRLLLDLLHDEEPLAREAALGQLLLIVQVQTLYQAVTPTEVAAAASAVIDDAGASERLKSLAETVLRLAVEARARNLPEMSAHPDGAANWSQPIRPESNAASSAVGSRR